MNLHAAAKALDGEVSGGQILCPGPGHNRGDRSLSVKFESNTPEGFIIHSFAGDDPIVCKDLVRSRLGLPAFEPGKKDAEPERKEVKKTVFEFRDPQTGRFAYSKTRIDFDDKTKKFYITPKHRGANEPLLYGGERVKQSPAVPWVWIVEGEKKVDRIVELGMLAVSGDTGELSKWLPSHAELLRGRQIGLWPDSDEPGEKYISNAAVAIRAADPNADIRIVRPFGRPTGAKGKDICDWSGDATDLVALADNAQPYVELAPASLILEPRLFTWRDPRTIPPRQWLYGGHLIRGYLSLTIAAPGIGKSSVELVDALAMATGRDLIGHAPASPMRIWYWNGEDPFEEIERRVAAIVLRYGIERKKSATASLSTPGARRRSSSRP